MCTPSALPPLIPAARPPLQLVSFARQSGAPPGGTRCVPPACRFNFPAALPPCPCLYLIISLGPALLHTMTSPLRLLSACHVVYCHNRTSPPASSVTRCLGPQARIHHPCAQTMVSARTAPDLGIHERRQRCQRHSGRGGSCCMAGPRVPKSLSARLLAVSGTPAAPRAAAHPSTSVHTLRQPAAPPRQVIQGTPDGMACLIQRQGGCRGSGWRRPGGRQRRQRRRRDAPGRATGQPHLPELQVAQPAMPHFPRRASLHTVTMAFQDTMRDVDGHGGKVGA